MRLMMSPHISLGRLLHWSMGTASLEDATTRWRFAHTGMAESFCDFFILCKEIRPLYSIDIVDLGAYSDAYDDFIPKIMFIKWNMWYYQDDFIPKIMLIKWNMWY
jgi:hypothetical protein